MKALSSMENTGRVSWIVWQCVTDTAFAPITPSTQPTTFASLWPDVTRCSTVMILFGVKVWCGNVDPSAYFKSLMVVGGASNGINDVEVIDLSGSMRSCAKPADYPFDYYSTGIYFDGYPTVCGGCCSYTNLCYKYEYKVTYV